MKNLVNQLNSVYDSIEEKELPFRRFSYGTFIRLLNNFEGKFKIDELGKSIEDRPIKSVTIGSGDIRIVVWTQMHGNESTATRAVFDFLNFTSSDFCTEEFKELLNAITLKFVPVLNPDGMVRYQRRNALDIDPNRDAARRTTPEMKLLFRTVEQFNPDWCFNMHDQRNLFNVGGSSKPASLSFLSPSTADGKRGKNQSEGMMLIDKLHQSLSEIAPLKMARFTHEYYPTASGDNFQNLGYRTILVESGGHRGDIERNISRKLNFILFWEAIRLIVSEEWKKGSILRYSEIPANDQKLFDLLIRNVSLKSGEHLIRVDIGIDRVEVAATTPAKFVVKSAIKDIGDLSYYYGYEEFNAEGMQLGQAVQLNQVANFDLIENGELLAEVKNGYIKHV